MMVVRSDSGDVEYHQEYGNAWGGHARIWTSIWDKYIKDHSKEYDTWLSPSENQERLWASYKDEHIPIQVRVVMAMTFDRVLIAKAQFKLMATTLRKFMELFPYGGVDHLPAWADELELLVDDETVDAVGFHATSVAENPFEVYREEEDDSRPYNVNTDEGHAYLFDMDEFKELLS